MFEKIENKYRKMKQVNIDKLLYMSIFIMLVGFVINGCLLKITYSISGELGDFTDSVLLIVEGLTIFITIFILLIKNPKKIICTYGICLGVFSLYYLLFPQNRMAMISMIKPFILYNLTSFILFMEISEDKKLFNKIVKNAKYIFIFSIIYLIVLTIRNETLYDIWLSKYFLFTSIFVAYDFYKNRRMLSAIITILCGVALIVTGSRSYMLTFCLFIFSLIISSLIKIIKRVSIKRKLLIIMIILIVVICIGWILINYKEICTNSYEFLAKNGLEIRILKLLSTDNFFTSNDRINIIYPFTADLIKENLIFGTGICGDRVAIFNIYEDMGKLKDNYSYDGYYSHNEFLELYSNFGIIIATIIIVIILFSYYKTIKDKRKNISTILCLSFITIFPLMLTGTIWNNVFLWSLLGLLCSNIFNKNDEKIKEERDKNVVMLLDNCFDPDVRVYKEAKYLVDSGINVEIICLDKKNKYKDKPIENFEGINIKRIFCRTEKTTKIIENNKIISKCKHIIYLWWLLKFIYKAKKYLKKRDFEILHCHDLVMAFIGCAFFNNKKIVFDMHEYYSNRENKVLNYFISKIVKYVQNRATWIIHVNNFQLNDMENKNKEKLVFIPNYPEASQFKDYNHIYSDYIRINYTGYVRHYIPLLNLMKAVNDIEGIKVYINGSGECYDSLKKIEATMKNTTLTGEYKHADILKFYENSDITYVVYNKENKNDETALPTKFYESIILCMPVIVSKDTLMANFVEKNNIGFIVDGTSYMDIKKVLLEILNDRESLIQKSNNMKKISQNYIWENIVRNLNRIYGDCDTKSKN